MQRKALLTLAIALAMGCASTAFAQDDDLSGVTLRVLDDVSDIDAVVLSIDRERDGAEGNPGEHRDGEGRDGDGRGDRVGDGDRDDGVRDREDRDDHDEPEDDDHLERGEGGLEDHDVERDREPEEDDVGDHRDGEPVEP